MLTCTNIVSKGYLVYKVATEGWLTIPGVGKRYRTSSGEIRNYPPNPLTPVRNVLGNLGAGLMSALSGGGDTTNYSQLNWGGQSRGLTPDQLRRASAATLVPPGYGSPAASAAPTGLTGIDTGKYGRTDWQRTANPSIVTGTQDGVTPDRRQSDQYRAAVGQQAPAAPAFPLTPQGQFDRYFKSGEMDQYFGSASRGKGAPANLEAMQQLASQKQAPFGQGAPSLATYYRAQSATGRGDMDEIVNAMGYKGTPMETWARSNPMLAFREYNKKFPAGQPTQGPSDQAIGQALKGGTFYPAEGSPAPFLGMAPTFMPEQPYTGPMSMPNSAIAGAGNVVPAPPGTQGTKPPIEDKEPIGFRVDKFLGRSTAPVGDFFVPSNPVG